jgi:hypothetical protein
LFNELFFEDDMKDVGRGSAAGVKLRDIFFLLQGEVLRIRPLRLKVAEKKHGGR